MGDFLLDIEKGKIGEVVVYDMLKKGNNCVDVIDVRDYDYFRDIDVDFIQILDNAEPLKIEVKTDMLAHKTGNIAYEYVSSANLNSIGCFEKTKSDFIFYYLYHTKQMYLIRTNALREYVNTHKDNLRLVRMGDNARGYLLAIEKLIKANVCCLV